MNKTENRKTIKKINKPRVRFFENMNKTGKPSANVTNIRKKKEEIPIDFTDIKK